MHPQVQTCPACSLTASDISPPAAPVNLREYRRRRGKSVLAQSAEIGISKKALIHAERGGLPRAATQLAIARAYGLDLMIQWPDDPDQA